MPSLQEMNDAKRAYAFSGRASLADLPYLYALQAEQGANVPPIGGAGTGAPGAARGGVGDVADSGAGVGFAAPASTGLRELGLGYIGGDEFGSPEGQAREALSRLGEQDFAFREPTEENPYPGRNALAGYVAALAPAPFSHFAAAVNAVGGIQALNKYSDLYQQTTGLPPDFGLLDYLTAATGVNFGGDYVGGVGGYGDASSFGAGGITNYIDQFDPGVAGPARALSRLAVDGGGAAEGDIISGAYGSDTLGSPGPLRDDFSDGGQAGERDRGGFGGTEPGAHRDGRY